MSTLVPNDPDTGAEETRPESVQRPEREGKGGIEVGVGQIKVGGGDELVPVLRRLVQGNNDS